MVTLPFAQQMLAQKRRVLPVRRHRGRHGEKRLLAGDPEQGEHPASAEVDSTLLGGLRHNRADLRAVAICSDVRLTDSDAVRVELGAPGRSHYGPYKKKKRLGRGVEYGALRAERAVRQVWP